MVKHFGGDVEAGLRQLLPSADWSFLNEREKRRSDKAEANQRQAKEKQEEAAARKAKRAQKRTAAGAAEATAAEAPADAPAVDGEVEASGDVAAAAATQATHRDAAQLAPEEEALEEGPTVEEPADAGSRQQLISPPPRILIFLIF